MITNQALYQLSYSSTWARIIGLRPRLVECVNRCADCPESRFDLSPSVAV